MSLAHVQLHMFLFSILQGKYGTLFGLFYLRVISLPGILENRFLWLVVHRCLQDCVCVYAGLHIYLFSESVKM